MNLEIGLAPSLKRNQQFLGIWGQQHFKQSVQMFGDDKIMSSWSSTSEASEGGKASQAEFAWNLWVAGQILPVSCELPTLFVYTCIWILLAISWLVEELELRGSNLSKRDKAYSTFKRPLNKQATKDLLSVSLLPTLWLLKHMCC